MKINRIGQFNIDNKKGGKSCAHSIQNAQFEEKNVVSAVSPSYWQNLTFKGGASDETFKECKEYCNRFQRFYEDFEYNKFLKQSYAFYKDADKEKLPAFHVFYELSRGLKEGDDVYLSLSEKRETLKILSGIANDEDKICDPDFAFVLPLINKLKADLSACGLPLKSDRSYVEECNRSIFISKKENKGGLNHFESVVSNSIPLFKNMESGLNLKYKRQDFLNDLNSVLNNKEKRENFAKQTGTLFKLKNGKISDYMGILNIDNLDEKDLAYDICRKFLYENEIQTEDAELNEELNKIIKAAPEFISIIGKRNDKKSEYPLDIHTLLTLAYAIKDEGYKGLSNKDKIVLKASCLFSDIGFDSSFESEEERSFSSICAREILGKFIKNNEILKRSFRISKNYTKIKDCYDINSEISQESLAYQLRGKNDLKIALIMAKADAKAMGGDFYNKNRECFSKESVNEIQELINYIHSNGIAFITDYPISKEKIEGWKTQIDGEEYKILNLHNIKSGEDMGKYGFHKGVKKRDLNFLVHMVSDIKNLENFMTVIKSSNDAVMSESLITTKNKSTLDDMKYGFVLAQSGFDIINASREDQGSGPEKNEGDAIEYMFDSDFINRREDFKISILKTLNLSQDDVDNVEFAKFYNENLAGKTSFLQFPSNKKYILNGKIFKGKILKKAIKEYQNNISGENDNYKGHNEIIGVSPDIKSLIAKKVLRKSCQMNF